MSRAVQLLIQNIPMPEWVARDFVEALVAEVREARTGGDQAQAVDPAVDTLRGDMGTELAELTDALDKVSERLAALEARPAGDAAAPADVEERLASVEGQFGAFTDRVKAIEEKHAALAAPARAPAAKATTAKAATAA